MKMRRSHFLFSRFKNIEKSTFNIIRIFYTNKMTIRDERLWSSRLFFIVNDSDFYSIFFLLIYSFFIRWKNDKKWKHLSHLSTFIIFIPLPEDNNENFFKLKSKEKPDKFLLTWVFAIIFHTDNWHGCLMAEIQSKILRALRWMSE